jgi:DNA-binding NarL/FixJ family response regulator
MKTLLVDDHALLRETLATVISLTWPSLQLLQAGSLAEARDQCDTHPDLQLVLLDLGLPDAQGLQSLQELQTHAPQARHVVLSAHDQPAVVLQAIDAGAAGFVSKTADLAQMKAALRRVLEGGIHLPPGLELPDPEPTAEPSAGPISGAVVEAALTQRQREVLGLLVDGLPNKSISRRLGLSGSTVKTHMEAIYRHLGVHSRSQAVVAAARLGLHLPLAGPPAH